MEIRNQVSPGQVSHRKCIQRCVISAAVCVRARARMLIPVLTPHSLSLSPSPPPPPPCTCTALLFPNGTACPGRTRGNRRFPTENYCISDDYTANVVRGFSFAGLTLDSTTASDKDAIREFVKDFVAVNTEIHSTDIGRITLANVDRRQRRHNRRDGTGPSPGAMDAIAAEVVLHARVSDSAMVSKVAADLTTIAAEGIQPLDIHLPSGTTIAGKVILDAITRQEDGIPDPVPDEAVPLGPYDCGAETFAFDIVKEACAKAGGEKGSKYYSLQAAGSLVTDELGMPDAVGCILADLLADPQLGRALRYTGIVVFEPNPGSEVARGTLVLNLAHPSDYIKVATAMFGVDPADVSLVEPIFAFGQRRVLSLSLSRACACAPPSFLPPSTSSSLVPSSSFPPPTVVFSLQWLFGLIF